MRNDTIETFLTTLADRVPAPGGGASAGLHAGQAAALVAMVARYSDSAAYEQHAEVIDSVRTSADQQRRRALTLAEDDMQAFTAVTDAYRMPKNTESEAAQRSAAIGDAMVDAAEVPARIIDVAGRVLALAEDLLPIGNPNVITDVAAAAEAARAASATARVNVEINLGGISDGQTHEALTNAISEVDDMARRAEKISAAVRKQVTS